MLRDLRDRLLGNHHRLAARLHNHGGELAAGRLGGVQRTVDEMIATLVRSESDAVARVSGRRVRPIQVHWVDNWDTEAIAFEVGRTPRVALYGGTATLLAGCSIAIARSAELWPDLPGGETAAESYGPLADCFARRWPEGKDTPLPSADRLYRPPDTSERVELASELLWTSVAFLFFHEAAHHRRGHVRRANRAFGATEIVEANVATPAVDDPEARAFQIMEIDADASAVRMALATSADARSSPAGTDRLPPERAVRLLLLSAGVLFNVFDYEHYGVAAFRGRRHPHPSVRLAATVVEAVAWAGRRGLLSDEIDAAVSAGLRDLQRTADALGWTLAQVMRNESAAITTEVDSLRAAAATMNDGG